MNVPLSLLACPDCRGPLRDDSPDLACDGCRRVFPVVQGAPCLLPAGSGGVAAGPRIQVEERPWVAPARRLLKVPSPTWETREVRESIPRFVASFPCGAAVANIGSAALRYREDVFNIDLLPGPDVDLVGDAVRLPLRDACLDGVICRRVLEHVRKPGLAVEEFFRVLRPDGRIWCEIPFLQGYHPTPTDFQRYTQPGLADLFDRFELLEQGVALGPSSTLSWVLREYLAILFSFDRPVLYKVGERLFSWLTLPVKFLDAVTARSRFASQIASSFYLVARKPGKRSD